MALTTMAADTTSIGGSAPWTRIRLVTGEWKRRSTFSMRANTIPQAVLVPQGFPGKLGCVNEAVDFETDSPAAVV